MAKKVVTKKVDKNSLEVDGTSRAKQMLEKPDPFMGCIPLKAYFINGERTTIRVDLRDPTTHDGFGNPVFRSVALEWDPDSYPIKKLLEFITVDQVHEFTFKNIREEQQEIKRIAIEVAKNNGWLLSDVALEDDIGFKKQNDKPKVVEKTTETKAKGKSKVVTKEIIKEIKVTPSMDELLMNMIFNENASEDYIFETKLKVFEMDMVTKCKNRELKKELRVATNMPSVLKALIAIYFDGKQNQK